MSRAYSFAVLIGGLVILSSVEVDAQSTVDDSESCESSTFNEAVKIIREDLKDVKLIREDLRSLLGSNRRQSSAVDLSSLGEYTRVFKKAVILSNFITSSKINRFE